MNSNLTTAVVWPSNAATPPPGWTRLTDSDGTQPSGWFTSTAWPYRIVVKGYPTWDEAPWPIPAEARYHDEEDAELWQVPFDLTYTTYRFPDLPTAAGPATHTFGNLDFCGGWMHELAMTPGGTRQNEALLARVLTGAKPTGLLFGSDADAERWAAAARAAGLSALVSRDWTTKVWISASSTTAHERPGPSSPSTDRRKKQMRWQTLLGVVAGLLLLYTALVGLLWRSYRHDPDTDALATALRLLPDLVRLIRRLAADPTLPRGVRIRLLLLVGYLLSPIDLIPDVIPVLGYADDAIIVAIALRSVVRRAGPEALERQWPGTPEGLHLVRRLAGL